MNIYKEERPLNWITYTLIIISVASLGFLYWFCAINSIWYVGNFNYQNNTVFSDYQNIKLKNLYVDNLLISYNGNLYNLTEILIKLNITLN